MLNMIKNFLKDEEGLTMIEYAVAGGLVTLGAIAAFTTLGSSITTKITAISDTVSK
ncbi:MAG: Flp family type IVb pilin [Gammaproteobacteria bacterium]|nr:Flp family type IVb pilin [Gammaproteobacteria bacterium]